MNMGPQHGNNLKGAEANPQNSEVSDLHSFELPKATLRERAWVGEFHHFKSLGLSLQEGFSAGEFQNCALPHQLLEGTPLGGSEKVRYRLKPLKDWTNSIDGNPVNAEDLAAALGAIIIAFPESDIAFEAAVILAKSSPTAGLLLINLVKQLDLFDEPSCFAIALATRVNENWCRDILSEIVLTDADPMIRCDALTVIARHNLLLAKQLATDIAADIGPQASDIISTALHKISQESDIPLDLFSEHDRENQSALDSILAFFKQTDENAVYCSALAGFLNSLPAHTDVVFPLAPDAAVSMETVMSRMEAFKPSFKSNDFLSFQNIAEMFVNDNGLLEVRE